MSKILELNAITKKFGGLVANENVSFDVEEGEIVGVVGPNGAGKTTLFNSISGAFLPTSGSITFNGKDITSIRLKDSGGFYVDVAQVDGIQPDLTLIRMNVDDFDEAYRKLEEKGFKNAQGDRITNTDTSESTMMVSPSGFSITITEHVKD